MPASTAGELLDTPKPKKQKTEETRNNDVWILTCLSGVMCDVGGVGKNGVNQAQKWAYRSIDDLYNAFHPAFAKYGIIITSEILNATEQRDSTKTGTIQNRVVLDVKYTLHATDGSSISSIVRGEGIDSGDKATSKALTYAYKYFLIQTFCVSLETERDPDADIVEPAIAKSLSPDENLKAKIWKAMQDQKIDKTEGKMLFEKIRGMQLDLSLTDIEQVIWAAVNEIMTQEA